MLRWIFVLGAMLVSLSVLATPSTLITIPSTDIQAKGVWHFGADTTIFTGGADAPSPFVDVGMTYGITPRLEAGIDLISSANNPVWLNAKALLLSPDQSPVPIAVGIYNWGTASATNQRILYLVGSHVFPLARLTFGTYSGRAEGLAAQDHSGSGILAGIDRTLGKWWLGIDYVSGKNALSSVNYGIAYAFTDNVSTIFSYDDYKTGTNAFDIQLDINLQ